MLPLGLLLTLSFIPGWTSASIPTQWAVLSAVLPCTLWHRGAFGPGHWLGLTSLLYAAASVLWSPTYLDGLNGLWHTSILALSFWLGATTYQFERLFKGLALGLGVSSAAALAQYLGWTAIPTSDPEFGHPAGLFFNSTLLGALCAITTLGLVEFRLWPYILLPLPGLLLSQSRGAWAITIFGLLSRIIPFPILIGLGASFAILLTLHPTQSDIQRIYLWHLAWDHLTLFGHGAGSWSTVYYVAYDTLFHSPVRLTQPTFTHNDYLQLWFELGIGAIPIYALLALALTQTHHTGWATLLSCAVLALFYFPLQTPVTAFILCALAGRSVASWHLTGPLSPYRRPDFLSWPTPLRPSPAPSWSPDIPSRPSA